jgi:hypothetical protein
MEGTSLALDAGMKNKITGARQIRFNAPTVESSGTVQMPESDLRTLDICWSEQTACKVELTHLTGRTGSLRRIKTAALILFAAVLIHLPAWAAQSAALSWGASPSASVTGYNIYYWDASGGPTNEIFVGNVTSATVSGLADGTTYQFAATAIDAAGNESPFSNLVSYLPASVATLAMQTVASEGGAAAISITATGEIPAQWAVQASTDLKTWTVITSGTNSSVNVSVPITTLPAQFFRLESE